MESHILEYMGFRLLQYCQPALYLRHMVDALSPGQSFFDSLPTVTLAHQTILSKIPNRYRNYCQVLGQDSGQPIGWDGCF